ncbi:MAG: FTR1 family iron permease [Syntrophales bacterium]
MAKIVYELKTIRVVIAVLAMVLAGPLPSVQAKGAVNYQQMTDEIGVFLNEALRLYNQGDVQEAKRKAQAAYFEVFENLEGPIRINLSARKNYELEEEFVAIRNMIVARAPAGAIEKKINAFMVELRSVTASLKGGFELVAESSDDAGQETGGRAGSAEIAPVWQQTFTRIQTSLGKSLEAYQRGNAKTAVELVTQVQFDDYKNSLLETAVRRYVSQRKDFENNAGFAEIAGMMQTGRNQEQVAKQITGLIKGLGEDLPGLPEIEGAPGSRETDKPAARDQGGQYWSQVTVTLFKQLGEAIALYEKGEAKNAVILVQEAYFDVFEASGMEKKIGARDGNFKAKIEGHFSKLASQMKGGAPMEKIREVLAAMRQDLARGVEMLGKGSDSPWTLFFYSLLIIIREGIEAILIITAIIAYLLKTGNGDKLRIIYNGCLTALILSGVTAVLVKWVFKVSAAGQELMEGGAMLLAAAVLFSVSYWLLSKAETRKWLSYIQGKVNSSLSANSLRALWFAAFLAVYREGAETILFYQALVSDATAAGVTAVAIGFGVGSLLLVGIYLGMRYGAVRLPLRPFFLGTGALLYYMAFVFAGKGTMELIEGKLIGSTFVSWMPAAPLLGLYPYVQTLAPQMLILLAAGVALAVMAKKRGGAAKEAATE